MPEPAPHDLLSTGTVAQRLGLHRSTVLHAIRAGRLVPAQRTPAGFPRFSPAAVAAYARSLGLPDRAPSTAGEATIPGATTRRQAEEEPRAGEERLRTVIGHAPVVLYTLDETGVFTLCEGRALQDIGQPPDALLGRSILAIYHDDTAVVESVRRALAGEPSTFVSRAAGRVFANELVPLRDAQGRIMGALGVATDVTARERAEEALQEHAARQAYLLRLSDAVRPLSDPVEIQYTAARVLGEHLGANRVHYVDMVEEREAVISRNYADGVASIEGRRPVVAYGDAEVVAALQRDEVVVIADVATDPRLSAAARRAFAAIDVAATIVTSLVKEGRWVGAFGVQSVTPRAWTALEIALLEETAERTWAAVERAHAEEALRASEKRFRLLADNASDIIARLTLEGVYLYVSPACQTVLGYAPHELVGSASRLLVHPADLPAVRAFHKALLQQGDPATVAAYRHRRKDGTYAWLETTSRVVRDARTGAFVEFQSASRDVTERQQAEEVRGWLAAIVAGSRDAIIGTDLDHTITSWNAGSEQLYGYPAAEVLGRSIDLLSVPGGPDGAAQIRAALLRGDAVETLETVRRHRDGRALPVSISVSPVRDASGAVIGAAGIHRDITAQVRAALAVEEARRLAEAMDRVSMALATTLDPDQLYRIILEQVMAVLPCESAGILEHRAGWVWLAASRGEPSVPPGTRLSPLTGPGRPWVATDYPGMVYVPDTDLEPAWVHLPPWVGALRTRSVIAVPLRIEGEVLGTFEISSTIPRRYEERHLLLAEAFGARVLQALRNARRYVEEQQRATAGTALAAVGAALATSTEPAEMYRIILDQLVTAVPCTAALAMSYHEGWARVAAAWGVPGLTPGTPVFALRDLTAHGALGDEVLYIPDCDATPPLAILPPDPGFHPRSLVVTRMRIGGEHVGSLCVLSSSPNAYAAWQVALVEAFAERLTLALRNAQLHAAEQQRTAAAESLAQLRSDFVSAVSHELRTPLTSILGFAQLLQMQESMVDEERRAAMLKLITTAANRQLRLVQDLLDATQVETEGFRCASAPFAVRPVLDQAAAEVRDSYGGQRVDLQGPEGVFADGDAGRTAQIVANLIDNAAKYSPEGSPVAVTWGLEDGQAVVRVQDRGSGIAEAERAQLFTRFGRLAGSQRRAGRSGTGLGLYLSRMLARAMEGELALESSGAHGSTFRLRLPAVPQGEEPAAPAPTRVPGGRVLVVEDNAINRLVVVALLESLGCTVETAETGRQAVAAVQQASYDLVLMDLHLPELDGWAATTAIRAHEQAAGLGQHTPIVAMTAGALVGDAEKSRAVGMDDHLTKPVTVERFAAVLARWARPRHAATPRKTADRAVGQAVLDRTPTEELRARLSPGTPDLLPRLVEIFVRDTPATIAALRAAAVRGDLPAVQEAAHSLKGSCGTLGAVALERLCQRIEEHAQAREYTALLAALEDLDATFAATCAALSALVAEEPGA